MGLPRQTFEMLETNVRSRSLNVPPVQKTTRGNSSGARRLQGLFAPVGDHHLVMASERATHGPEERRIIVDDQYASRTRRPAPLPRILQSRTDGQARHELRSAEGAVVHRQHAAVLAHDVRTEREPEAGAQFTIFCGEKGLKNALAQVRWHPRTVILDRQRQGFVICGRRDSDDAQGVPLVGHGLRRVEQEIHENLCELGALGPQRETRVDVDLDACAGFDLPRDHLVRRLRDVVQAESLHAIAFEAREPAQLLRDGLDALDALEIVVGHFVELFE